MKFIENDTEKIVKGILIGGLVCAIGYVLVLLAQSSAFMIEQQSPIGLFVMGTLCKPVGIMIIFKFTCDVIYKILKAIDKYMSE